MLYIYMTLKYNTRLVEQCHLKCLRGMKVRWSKTVKEKDRICNIWKEDLDNLI